MTDEEKLEFWMEHTFDERRRLMEFLGLPYMVPEPQAVNINSCDADPAPAATKLKRRQHSL